MSGPFTEDPALPPRVDRFSVVERRRRVPRRYLILEAHAATLSLLRELRATRASGSEIALVLGLLASVRREYAREIAR
jgi:hypothetical protein